MLNGFSGPDEYEPVEDWLYSALAKVNRLPERVAADKRLNQAARTLLRSIEAELICAPDVWRGPLDRVHIKFKFGSRSVEFVVTRQGCWAIRSSPCETWPHKSCKGWPGEFAREEIRFVYATSNMTTDLGMIATMRDRN